MKSTRSQSASATPAPVTRRVTRDVTRDVTLSVTVARLSHRTHVTGPASSRHSPAGAPRHPQVASLASPTQAPGLRRSLVSVLAATRPLIAPLIKAPNSLKANPQRPQSSAALRQQRYRQNLKARAAAAAAVTVTQPRHKTHHRDVTRDVTPSYSNSISKTVRTSSGTSTGTQKARARRIPTYHSFAFRCMRVTPVRRLPDRGGCQEIILRCSRPSVAMQQKAARIIRRNDAHHHPIVQLIPLHPATKARRLTPEQARHHYQVCRPLPRSAAPVPANNRKRL